MANILYRGSAVPSASNTAGANNAPLTNDQIDKNLYALNTDKLDKVAIAAQSVASPVTFSSNVTINGNLQVDGTSTTINTTVLNVDDINIELGAVGSPSNATATGGGITLLAGADGNKTITWDTTNANWTSSEHWNIANGKKYKINNADVLTSTTLGSGVINSSLTKLGTTAGFVKSDASGNLTSDTTAYLSGTVAIANGGTNITSYAAGDILYASAANVLSKLAKGTNGQVLKLSDGLPAWGTDNDTVYSLPLAASGTRGGVQVGYTTTGKNYAVQLDGEKMYVNVPWTDTDTNTWQANTKTADGYVTAGGTSANLVWKTDASGNPAWRTDSDTVTTVGVGTAAGVSGDVKLVAGSNVTITRSGQDITITSSYTDTNTWNANAVNVAGYVAAPISSTSNLVWKTDASGNPAWRADSDTTYSAGTGLTLTGTSFSVNYGSTSTTACVGNDSRLSDARTPLAHTHSYLPLTGGTLTGDTTLSNSGQGWNAQRILSFTTGYNNSAVNSAVDSLNGTIKFFGHMPEYTSYDSITSTGRIYSTSYSDRSNLGGYQVLGTVGIQASSFSGWSGAEVDADAARLVMRAAPFYLAGSVTESNFNSTFDLPRALVINGGRSDTIPGTNICIFQANGTTKGSLDTSGNFVVSSNITAYGSPSDRNLKENIQPLTNSLEKVKALQGVSFDWKKETAEHTMVGMTHDIGLIAQNVQEVLPELVREGEDGFLSLRDRGLVAVLIEAIKELNAKVEDLQNQLANK